MTTILPSAFCFLNRGTMSQLPIQLSAQLQQKYDRLREILTEMGDVIIGMSGGVDSVLLSKVASAVLGEKALAVTAD